MAKQKTVHSNTASGNYKIGYARPPQQYKFEPGRIANPKGNNQHTAPSIARDMKLALERELNKQVKIRQGKRTITVRQTIAGIGKLVHQFVEGNPRARRDLILLCEKVGVELIDRDTLQGTLEDALSAEDEALLADFVRRHGGQYPIPADAPARIVGKVKNLISPPADYPKLLSARRE